ncbi:MAG: rRNA maturation RNase YbeY [Bacteroidia bacterium]|nr:rRNA maturation RNase YbeY [Bacteroidia bacterium]
MRRAEVLPIIRFHAPDGGKLRHAHQHRHWLLHCWKQLSLRRDVQRIDYYFVSRETISHLHKKFLSDDRETDILTFDYGESAEIFICPSVIREHAQRYRTTFAMEMRRVMIHGVLHMLGFDDSEESAQEAMRHIEDFCLEEWKNCFT